ncbi:MAG: ComEC/Rec2 family competence protein [Salinivirgaceae bacterium]|jgi:competence protein ComEC|nr:ComEC/Rec2 family competence protein [Salinivirgaceae bacterium]
MLLILKNNPIIRLLIPFLAGLISAMSIKLAPSSHIDYLIWVLVAAYIIISTRKYSHIRNRVCDLLLIALFFSLGVDKGSLKELDVATFSKPVVMLLQLTDYPDSTANSVKLQTTMVQTYGDSVWKNRNAGATIYMENTKEAAELEVGEYIYAYAKPDIIENKNNPGEFDFKSWAATNGVYYQFYLSADKWEKTTQRQSFQLIIELKKLRRKLFDYYRGSGMSSSELAVFSALTLGDKSMLDHDLRQGYASAGLMHILAVSGLHVGIIYVIVLYLFKPVASTKWGKRLRFIVSICILWGYAMLTGLSPSVTRAATMFSVFVAGDLAGRKYAVYNSMALAAFLLLFHTPEIITNVGFQMSFLAVFGIVTFFPHIKRWLYFKHGFLRKGWELIAVSLAAQAITTPLALSYFNQFPLLFLLSNILMVPLATGLMYLFVAMVLAIPFPAIATPIGILANWLTYGMNYFANWVNNLDWATVRGIHLTLSQMLLLYAILFLMGLWGVRTSYKNLKLSFYALLLFALVTGINQYQIANTNSLTVFNTDRHALFMQRAGKKYTIYNSGDKQDARWYTKPIITTFGLEKNNKDSLPQSASILWFGNSQKRGIFYNTETMPPKNPLSYHWLILSEKSPYNLKKLLSKINTQTIIVDATVSRFKLQKWREQIAPLNIHIYDIQKRGAFIAKW